MPAKRPSLARVEPLGPDEVYVFECTRVCSISIDSPETCPFLKDILKSISKGKEKDRVIAFRDLSSALEKLDDGKGVRVAIYLLENGVLPPLLAGLDKAARGDWILLQPDPIQPKTMQISIKLLST
jgi:hypothetical protein